MSNEKLAREWAQFELDNAGEFSDKGRIAAAEHIMATTTPLTMADVEWSDEKHHLAGAIDAEGTEVVMIGTFSSTIRVCDVDEVNETFAPVLENPGTLTPNGKKYELREIGAPEQPEHPATLTTLEDYEDAPVGTIVVTSGTSGVLTKVGGKWKYGAYEDEYNEGMATFEREVLRWGWGK